MKTITLQLVVPVVPDWAKWVATNPDGWTRVFEEKPYTTKLGCDSNGTEQDCGFAEPPSDFTKTLRRI